MTPREAITRDWIDRMGDGPVALGYDIATTAKGTSNPSSVTVSQRDGKVAIARLIVVWKTPDPEVAKGVLEVVFDHLEFAGVKPRRLVVDASSERYYAANVAAVFRRRCPVELIGGNQKLKFRGEELDAKSLLGNMYASALEDGLFLLPAGEWIELDHRLVKREAGRFVTELGPNGEHGDTFDSSKLSYWGLQSGGQTRASSAPVGDAFGRQSLRRPGIIGPIGKLASEYRSRNHT
jgi:hypothetical protein